MNVYIEYVLIDNMVINYLILLLSFKLLKLEYSVWRILFGAGIGTLVAFCIPFIQIQSILLTLFKLLLGLVMVLCVLRKYQLKHWLRFYLAFLMFTFVMGGICFGVVFLLSGHTIGTTYTLDVPVGLILGITLIWSRYVSKLINAVHKRHKLTMYNYEIILTLKSKKIKLNAYFDTGNLLVDSNTTKPIVIVSLAKVIDELDTDEIRAVLTGNTYKLNLDEVHFEEFKAMSTTGKMLVFKAKSVFLGELNKDLTESVLIALSVKPLSQQGNFDALIGPKVLNGG